MRKAEAKRKNEETNDQAAAETIGGRFLWGGMFVFIYPDNLKAKPMLWLWLLRDIGVVGIGALLSVLALTQGLGMGLLVVTVLYAFLAIQVEGSSILDFLRRAACVLFLGQQAYEWRLDP